MSSSARSISKPIMPLCVSKQSERASEIIITARAIIFPRGGRLGARFGRLVPTQRSTCWPERGARRTLEGASAPPHVQTASAQHHHCYLTVARNQLLLVRRFDRSAETFLRPILFAFCSSSAAAAMCTT